MLVKARWLLIIFLTAFSSVLPINDTVHADSLPRSKLIQINEKEAVVFTLDRLTVSNHDIPVTQVTAKPTTHQLIPSGQSIGMQMEGNGVVIVGFEKITVNNETTSPAKDAGCEVGDIIVSINDTTIQKMSDMTSYLNKIVADEELTFEVMRKGEKKVIAMTPILTDDDSYRLGLLIQDQLSGVGTLTYVNPATQRYGGLGHNIYPLSEESESVENGLIFYSYVDRINKSEKHIPGEKEAHFLAEKGVLGAIRQHSIFGIFGELTKLDNEIKIQEPIPVAKPTDVQVGPAEFLTVISGEKVERFSCEVIDVTPQTSPEIKSFVIKLTDERLIEQTGGIVQGMSGSPIIQNGKLIGAITHVFVNDPLKGYGVHVQWMLEAENQIERQKAA